MLGVAPEHPRQIEHPDIGLHTKNMKFLGIWHGSGLEHVLHRCGTCSILRTAKIALTNQFSLYSKLEHLLAAFYDNRTTQCQGLIRYTHTLLNEYMMVS